MKKQINQLFPCIIQTKVIEISRRSKLKDHKLYCQEENIYLNFSYSAGEEGFKLEGENHETNRNCHHR